MNIRRWIHALPTKMHSIFRRTRAEQDLDEELSFHLSMQTRAAEARGLSRPEAERRARLELNGLQQTRERSREMWPLGWADNILQDFRYGCRTLRKSPAFAAVSIVTLALGIGANTAIFSAVQSILLRPLPYPQPDRLVMIWEDASAINFPRNTPAPANYLDWKQQNRAFTDVAATTFAQGNLTIDGPPERLVGRAVTPNFFSVLGVQPVLGRSFTEDEDAAGAPVVVISHRLWQRRYAGAPDIVGRTMMLNGSQRTILGVMPREFTFRDREIDFWPPIHFTPAQIANRDIHFLNVVARLRPEVSLEQARGDMSRVARDLATRYPDSNGRLGAVVVPVAEDVLGNTRLELLILMGAAGAVLLIACANLASLLMSRALSRRGELAIRGSLGATRARLVQQLAIEALLLAFAGGILGLGLAPAGTRVLADLVPSGLPALDTSVVRGPLLAFTSAVSLVTALLFSLVPALHAARGSLQTGLQQGGRSGIGGGSQLIRDGLVVAQMAMALVLLVGAGLMLRTLANLRAIDLGFASDHLLTMQVAISPQKYAEQASRVAFYDRVLDGTRTIPGVQRAAFASTLPFMSVGNTTGYQLEGLPSDRGRDALIRVVAGDYLSALGVQLLEGRLLEAADSGDAPKVVVVNETLARRHWPTGSALGHQLTIGGPTGPAHAIVGVVKDVRERGYLLEMKPAVYLRFPQGAAAGWLLNNLVVQVSGAPLAPLAAIRRVVASVDPEQPITAVRTMDEIVDGSVADRRQPLTLLGAFAGLALLLAVIGLYGVLSYAVTQRKKEIGLRLALGATAGSVLRLIVARGLALTVAGLSIGLLLALGVIRAMTSLLYGVGPTDAATFGGVTTLLLVVALAACALPAFRATRVDPMRVLRQE